MFIAALFTMAKKYKQPKCPSSDDWIHKIHTTESYLAIKEKLIQATKR